MIHSPGISSAGLPSQLILQKFYSMLEEDIGFGDATTSALISNDQTASARLVAREPGVVAGMAIAHTIFHDLGCSLSCEIPDGSEVKANSTLLIAQGRAITLLSIERTLLNLLQRMSGIATATTLLLSKARAVNSEIRVAATRKTAPLLRLFDKLAVMIGGGDSHRWRLDDAILIKDNHLVFYPDLKTAIQQARVKASFTCPIEIEVTTSENAIRAAEEKVDFILLDNMSPNEVSKVVPTLRKLHSNIVIEVSGNITSDNIAAFAKTGVDVISVGWITHSAPALDLSIDIKPAGKNHLKGG